MLFVVALGVFCRRRPASYQPTRTPRAAGGRIVLHPESDSAVQLDFGAEPDRGIDRNPVLALIRAPIAGDRECSFGSTVGTPAAANAMATPESALSARLPTTSRRWPRP